jgi:signal transduction histidine kinase/ActR/RegA family two-component response regulator
MIRTLILQIPSQTGAGVVVASYMVGTAWAFNPPAVVIGWGAAMLLAVFARWAVGRAFGREQRADDSLGRWATLYALSMAAIGTMYGIAFLLFAHPEQPVTIALALAALYSVAAGSTPSCAYHPPAILGAVIPAFAAVFVKLLLTGDFEYILLGIASALYGLTMISYCRVQSRTLQEGFRIRFENVELVERLEQRTAEAEEARHKADAANLAKSQFLAAASHDLRQPLYALGLFSSSLGQLKLDDAGRNVVGRIQGSIGALEGLFEGLLDLSKLETGAITPTLGPVSVDLLFDRLCQIFRPLALERGLDLRLRCDGEVVWSDPVLLEQVLSNLVANAIRYTERGAILLAVRRRGDHFRFEVWDTGVGIASDDRRRIFEEYVQLANPARDRRKGLGLGLAIARRAAALLDTEIRVSSRPGRGSLFTLLQPASDACVDVGEPDGASFNPPVRRRPGLPVLLVEDDEDVRVAFCDLARRWGVEIDAVGCGAEALARVAQGARYGLLVTDQRLGNGLSGVELIGQFRAELADPPPAVLITGDLDQHLVQQAQDLQVPILSKPVRSADLLALLDVGQVARERA